VAKTHDLLDDPVTAMHEYAEWYSVVPDAYRIQVLGGLVKVVREAVKSADLRIRLAQDAFCRDITTTILHVNIHNSNRDDPFRVWCDAVVAAQQTKTIEGADRLAWAAYSRKQYDDVRFYLDLADPSLPYANWIRAKLLMRDGKNQEAIEALGAASSAMPLTEQWTSPYRGHKRLTNCRSAIHAENATLFLNTGSPSTALDLYIAAGRWLEAAYVAERVMTLDDLEARMKMPRDLYSATPMASGYDDAWMVLYMQRALDESVDHSKTLTPGTKRSGTLYDLLGYLYARRLARNGEWAKAIPYFPPHVRSIAQEVAKLLNTPRTPMDGDGWFVMAARRIVGTWYDHDINIRVRTLDRTWAESQMEAAMLIRQHGMELLGTEIEPDWHFFHGNFEHTAVSGFRAKALPNQPGYRAQEAERVRASGPKPSARFHYRYVAANLMWDAAAHLPNNDTTTMRALYLGGLYLKDRDPEFAEKFYRELVRRNPNMPYAKETAKKRWFLGAPPEESEP
jgi:hypothetical protein